MTFASLTFDATAIDRSTKFQSEAVHTHFIQKIYQLLFLRRESGTACSALPPYVRRLMKTLKDILPKQTHMVGNEKMESTFADGNPIVNMDHTLYPYIVRTVCGYPAYVLRSVEGGNHDGDVVMMDEKESLLLPIMRVEDMQSQIRNSMLMSLLTNVLLNR